MSNKVLMLKTLMDLLENTLTFQIECLKSKFYKTDERMKRILRENLRSKTH